MTPDRFLPFALSVQILMTFLAPPLAFGERRVFVADLWAYLWIGGLAIYAMLRETPTARRRLILVSGGLAAVFAVVLLHGSTRESLYSPFRHLFDIVPDDAFYPLRETVVAGRFLVWILGAALVARARYDRRIVDLTLAGTIFVSMAGMLAIESVSGIRQTVGHVYLYDPNVPNWADRNFGFFPSPIEASAAFALSILLLIRSDRIERTIRWLAVGAALACILLTRTLTAFVAMFAAITLVRAGRFSKKEVVTAAVGVIVGLSALIVATWRLPFAVSKRNNFIFRVKPWGIYWERAMSDWDTFLLGNGFIPHYSDNTAVFLFSRGGVLLVSVAVVPSVLWFRRHWSKLEPEARAIPIFLLLASLTTDAVIFRPVVYLMLALGVTSLRSRRESRDT